MPPAMKGEADLVLSDGREFVVTMNHAALFDAEEAAGIPLPRLMAQGKLGFMGATRTFLFAALRPRHPDITLEQASEMTLADFDKVNAALTKAMGAAFPDAKEGKDDKNPPPKAARTGKRSGGSGAKSGSSRKPSGRQPRARSKSSSAPG